jgi:hypothetical protein
MFVHSKAFLLATATAICLPALASAATVEADLSANGEYTYAELIPIGETLELRFRVLEDLTIDGFSLAATGTRAGADIADMRYGFEESPTGIFAPILMEGTSARGLGSLGSRTLLADTYFSVFVTDGVRRTVSLGLSFGTTAAVSAIPLPATALLLLPLLVAGGALGRRRNAAKRLANA